MKLKPPPGKKLVRDWLGLRVKTLRPMRNGWCDMAAGTIATVDGAGHTGLHLKTDACTCCGVRVSISMISHEDVEVVQ